MRSDIGIRDTGYGIRDTGYVTRNPLPVTLNNPLPVTRRGFTYIEILISLAVIAVLFIPMTQLFSHAIYSVSVSGEGVTAVNLCRWEMERVKNLSLTKSGLKKIGDVWTPALDEPPLEMNQSKWRVLRHINPDSDPLEITVEVYRADSLNKTVASAVTLIEDNIWK